MGGGAEAWIRHLDVHATALKPTTKPRGRKFTILLRSAENGRLWNRPLTLSAPDETYHLRLQRADFGTWAPNYFT